MGQIYLLQKATIESTFFWLLLRIYTCVEIVIKVQIERDVVVLP
jgi:hypothetical protein